MYFDLNDQYDSVILKSAAKLRAEEQKKGCDGNLQNWRIITKIIGRLGIWH